MTSLSTHSTLSPLFLLGIAVVTSFFAVLVVRRSSKGVSVARGIAGTLALVYLAGAHIPLVNAIAPKTFCFGDIGVVHVLSFILPPAAVSVFKLWESPSRRAL